MNRLTAVSLGTCLLLAGCPADRQQDNPQPESGSYAEYSQLLSDLGRFEPELRRLQEHFAGEGSPAAVSSGTAQNDYKLGQRIRDDGIAIVVRNQASAEEFVLWVWQDSAEKQAAPVLVNQQESGSGGMSLQYQLDNDIFLSLSLRWVQDRYLEVKRNYEAGGLDVEYPLGSDYTAWTLDCPPLPYRLAPSASGPFGVLEQPQADGGWHGADYPAELMLPALAAYDQSRGLLLGISDEHPRRLDREYHCDWRLANGTDNADGNRQLRIDYGIYNSTLDAFTPPILISGLPQRDSVVLEPFSLQAGRMEDAFLCKAAEQVADRLSDYVAAFHARYQPALAPEWHSLLDAPGISPEMQGEALGQLKEVLQLRTGLWDTRGIITDSRKGHSLPDGAGGSALPADCLAMCAEYGISEWQRVSPFSLPAASSLFSDDPQLAALPTDGANAGRIPLSLRRPATADLLLSGFADATGLSLLLDPDPGMQGGQDPASMPLGCSQAAAASLILLKLCEDNAERDEPLELAIQGLPSLAVPPCSGLYVLPHSNEGPLLRDRMLGMLVQRIFGVSAYAGSGITSTAGLGLAVSDATGGIICDYGMTAGNAGELLQLSDKLQREAGPVDDYVLLYCEPRYGSYTLTGEAPAAPQSALIGMPAAWSGRSLLWVSCFGSGVDALVDSGMQMLNLQLDNGASVLQPMPFGVYQLRNSDPAAISAGEVLLLERDLATPGMGDQG
ncbi:MAG: hypothetical protein R3F46_15245 [bacterium]